MATNGELLFSLGINGELVGTNTMSGLAQLQIATPKALHLPINLTAINEYGSDLVAQRLTQPVWTPKNTVLTIYPTGQLAPNGSITESFIFYHRMF